MSDHINIFPAPEGFGSTALNPQIQSYADLVYRTKSLLGWPGSQIELTDAQWASIIDESIETWTQWEGNRKEEVLVFCANRYRKGCGIKLDDLVQVGCNTNYCNRVMHTSTVTSTELICDNLGTFTAYLSVTPFTYPTPFNPLDPYSVAFSGISGQNFYLYYDPTNPWDANNVCQANCVSISPVNSQYYLLSSNPNISSTIFDFVDDSRISNLTSAISAYVGSYDLSSVPLTALGDQLSAISPCFYDLSAFYPANFYYPPVSLCLNIGHGSGAVYPKCNTNLISSCLPLSSQYDISTSWSYILTSIPISSTTVSITSETFPSISSFFTNFCDDCYCNCSSLATYTSGTSSYDFLLYQNVLSGMDGMIYDLSSKDISNATHLKLYNVPSCTTDGSIPLNSNNGIVGTFTLCNSALSTNGPMPITYAQFFNDYKPPTEILCDTECGLCGWENNGFTMTYYNSAYGNCVRTTPELVPVNVTFSKSNISTSVGIVSTYLDGSIDPAINKKRKVLGVYTVEAGSQTGYGGYGGDLLFNFDYALMASTFGYDLNGTRTSMSRNGYDLLTYHMAKSFVEMSRDMLRYVSYRFDAKTQWLQITPEPPFNQMGSGLDDFEESCCGGSNLSRNSQCYIAGLYLEPTIQECLSEYWVREWVLARAMWTLGRMRSKFTGVTLYGGIQLNGDQLVQEGSKRMEQLLKELRQDLYYSAPAVFFIG